MAELVDAADLKSADFYSRVSSSLTIPNGTFVDPRRCSLRVASRSDTQEARSALLRAGGVRLFLRTLSATLLSVRVDA